MRDEKAIDQKIAELGIEEDIAATVETVAEETPVADNKVAAAEAKPDAEVKPPVEAKKEEPKEEAFSRQFALLRKAEKSLTERESANKREREAWQQERDTVQKELAEMKELISAVKSGDPIEALTKLGMDFNELAARAANGGKPSTDHLVKEQAERVARLEKQLEAEREQRAREAEQIAIDNYKSDIAKLVAADDRFELIRLQGEEEEVFNVILNHFENTKTKDKPGEVLSTEVAAEMVENYLLQKANKYAKAKKLGLMSQQAAVPAPQPKAQVVAQTINNNMSQSPDRGNKPMTRAEKLAAADKYLEAAERN